MTINERKQLSEYIKGLVRESIGEMDSMPSWWNEKYGPAVGDEDFNDRGADSDLGYDEGEDEAAAAINADREEFDNWGPDGTSPWDDDEYEETKSIAGLNELRRITESMARDALAGILMEKKGKKKSKKRKNKKEKSSSKDKTIVSQLNADGTNAAHYFYKLYGVENGTEAQKASARSKGYKKAKGKKNDTGVPYKFNSKERNRLSSLLTDRG